MAIGSTKTYDKHVATGNIVIDPTNQSITKYVWTIKMLASTIDCYFGIAPLKDTYTDPYIYRVELSEGAITKGSKDWKVGYGNSCAIKGYNNDDI